MKFFALILVLVALMAVGASAQQPPVIDTIANGKTYIVTAARDTIHSTATRAAGVAAVKWRGPITYYTARSSGVWSSRVSLPTQWHI